MLIFIIEDVPISEDIYSTATAAYIHERVELAKYILIGLSGAFVLMSFAAVLVIVYRNIVKPITELTDQIMKPHKANINKFVEEVHKKRTIKANKLKKQRNCFKNCCKGENNVDEVDELRFQFTRFFS